MRAISPRTPAKKPAAKPALKSKPKRTAKPGGKNPSATSSATPVKSTAAKNPVAKKRAADVPSTGLCKRIVAELDKNKAEDISTLPLADQCSFADFMIVASGRAPRHVVALADYVTDLLKKSGTPPLSVEGKETGDWVLIDGGDIIVHIFRPEVRQFYNIEKMWAIPVSTARD